MIYARQSTAIIVTVGPVLDADGVAVTGGVIGDFKISKNGAAPAALDGTATLTHRHTGFYSLSMAAADVATVGTVEIVIDDTVNACPMKDIQVVEEAIYDAFFAASANAFAGAAGSTTLTALASGSITAAVIATGAIDADAIADNAIDAGAIATGAITSAKFAAGAIDAAAIADNAIDAGALAADCITAAKIAAGAIDAATFAADVDAEILSYIVDDATRIDASQLNTHTAITAAGIADAVWDEDATGHQTGGTFGQAIGDPGANTLTMYNRIIQLGDCLVGPTGAVNDVAATTTSFNSGVTGYANNYWNDSILVFTSGALVDQARPIKTYTQASGVFTFDEGFTSAPADGSTFQIRKDHIHPVTQIATTIWQDTTAGDFTVASSIGKSLYTSGVVPGGSGGLLISGSNSGTLTLGALTVSGATTLTGAVSLGSTLGVTGAITATNAANNLTLGTFTVTTNAIAWPAAWDAEVQSEAADAITAAGLATQVSVDDLPTNAELATALGTADDAVLTAIDNLPTNAELATALGTADDATLAAIAALNNLSAAQVRTELATELARIDVAISTRLATAGYTAPDNAGIAAILDDTGTSGVVVAAASKSGYALSASGADLVLVDGKTLPAAIQIVGAVVGGKISGAGTGTEIFLGLDGATTRVTVTVDSSGNRSAVVYG